ncbi:glycine betaine/proline transport system ATP-binding protein [Rhizobium giardinii]|uniref:Quaternary amine transport ATP-binding protein n=2 Tax=Rhizobium giardinii TaxID=56731 RepID=A0A7W8XCB8_9HYPH|nr:glycine betaine/proline transport system ATP-binding protein [Rhizobium giardinii]
MNASIQRDIAVACAGVWKVFGNEASAALDAIQRHDLNKDEVLAKFGCVVAVRDVSFEIKRGEILCIMGLSGSGKSTLVRHINRLIDPTSGKILIDGEDIGALDSRKLRHLRGTTFGMVFQNFALLPHHTVRDNVAFGLELLGVDKLPRWERAQSIIDQIGLKGWEDRYPSELSGGMCQRVGIARAMAVDPSILLMDEPFSALDPLIRRDLQTLFADMSRSLNKTTLFITHDLEEAFRLGDRIAIMKDGQIVQIGTAAQIVSNPADDYVADFVSGISRLQFLKAAHVMEPLDEGTTPTTINRERALVFNYNSTLDELVNVAARGQDTIFIEDEAGMIVGRVTKQNLLSAIKEHR